MTTNEEVIDQQEDKAFDAMDFYMSKAQFTRGSVVIKRNKATVYCYDLDSLKRELLSIGQAVITKHYGNCSIDLSDVVLNIIDEYSIELRKANVLRNSRKPRAQSNIQRFKQAS